ncbi:MAG: hypothetical protein HZC51_09580 [Nitrospirae bacterium]|nr:hypothetical protein [Nitrospirota bacterium]
MEYTSIVVDVLRVGASGFAVVMFGYSFKLFKDLINEGTAEDASPATLALFDRKSSLVKHFMSVSIIFFILGMAGQYFIAKQKHNVTVSVNPQAMPEGIEAPMLRTGKDRLDLGKGVVEVGLTDGADMNIEVNALTDAIRDARVQLGTTAKNNVALTGGGLDEAR